MLLFLAPSFGIFLFYSFDHFSALIRLVLFMPLTTFRPFSDAERYLIDNVLFGPFGGRGSRYCR